MSEHQIFVWEDPPPSHPDSRIWRLECRPCQSLCDCTEGMGEEQWYEKVGAWRKEHPTPDPLGPDAYADC